MPKAFGRLHVPRRIVMDESKIEIAAKERYESENDGHKCDKDRCRTKINGVIGPQGVPQSKTARACIQGRNIHVRRLESLFHNVRMRGQCSATMTGRVP